MNAPLLERYRDRIAGVLTCYDRIVITGTLPGACYAAGMTSFLNAKHIRIFDYPRFAEPLRDRILDRYAKACCPVLDVFDQTYHWSLMQVECSTDLAFRSEATMKPLYEAISREAILSVKAEQVMTFLGKKLTPQLAQELDTRLHLHDFVAIDTRLAAEHRR